MADQSELDQTSLQFPPPPMDYIRTYTDEATGATLSNTMLRAATVITGDTVAAVTALTEVAVQVAGVQQEEHNVKVIQKTRICAFRLSPETFPPTTCWMKNP